jgi:hypothetical protein
MMSRHIPPYLVCNSIIKNLKIASKVNALHGSVLHTIQNYYLEKPCNCRAHEHCPKLNAPGSGPHMPGSLGCRRPKQAYVWIIVVDDKLWDRKY